ncbi:MAG: ATP-binding cassette domain-containing protein, partial [Pikeienuella sp.]
MITLNNIEKKYTTSLFQKVSYSFKEGNIYVLAGDMGTGKSTLLKMIVGLTRPTSGQIIHSYERKE